MYFAEEMRSKGNFCIETADHRPLNQIAEAYQQADVFVLPSLRETSGNVLLEAMAYAVPIVAFDTSFCRVLKEVDCGVFVNTDQALEGIKEDWCKAIVTLGQDKELAKQMGLNGYKYVNSKLTWDEKPDRFEKLVAFQLHLEELCASDVYSDEVRYRIKRPFLDNLLACMKSEVNCVKEIGVKEIHRSISQMCTNKMVQKIVWMVPDASFSRARRMIHFCIRHKMSFSTIVLIRAQQYLGR